MPVRASPVPSVVRGSLFIKFLSSFLLCDLCVQSWGVGYEAGLAYTAHPKVICSASTDMYHPGPILDDTGRYVAGFALHTATALYIVTAFRRDIGYIGGATFLTMHSHAILSARLLS